MSTTAELTLTIRRHFKAPVERVFDCWTTDPHSTGDFWGPKGFTFVSQQLDLRAGGKWQMAMRAPDGEVHRSGGVYREVRKPTYLEMTHGWVDEHGNFTSPQTVVRITLSASGNGTDMLFEQSGFESTGSRDGHREGWTEAFDSLAAHLHSPAGG